MARSESHARRHSNGWNRTRPCKPTNNSPTRGDHMNLPTDPHEPTAPFDTGWVLIYGDDKSGKSTFAATFPQVLFIHLEPRLDHIQCFRMPDQAIESVTHLRDVY